MSYQCKKCGCEKFWYDIIETQEIVRTCYSGDEVQEIKTHRNKENFSCYKCKTKVPKEDYILVEKNKHLYSFDNWD